MRHFERIAGGVHLNDFSKSGGLDKKEEAFVSDYQMGKA